MTRRRTVKPDLRPSVAHLVTFANGMFSANLNDCAVSCGNKEKFNSMLEQLGYKPVRLTRNLMNPQARDLVIDADTPLCCDVGSETYWSM